MSIKFIIKDEKYLIELDKKYQNQLLIEYSPWFYKTSLKNDYNGKIIFQKNNSVNIDIINYFNLCNYDILGIDNNTNKKICRENNNLYIETFTINNNKVYFKYSIEVNEIIVSYFNEITINEIINLLKDIYIYIINYNKHTTTCLIHGCGISINNKAVIFLGKSGAGKTTIAKFCKNAKYKILSDETLLIWKNGSHYMVQGTPWHGSEKIIVGSAEKYKLDNIYFLNQSTLDYSQIENNNYLIKIKLYCQLLSSSQFNFEMFILNVKNINELIKARKFRNLYFTKSNKFIKTIIKDMADFEEII